MAQTIVLAPTSAAATSDPIIVSAGEVVSVHLYGALTDDFQASLEREVGDGAWSLVTHNGRPFVCHLGNRDFTLGAPGTYRINKVASRDAIGAVVDR